MNYAKKKIIDFIYITKNTPKKNIPKKIEKKTLKAKNIHTF
jgi:hypothetical protein